MIEYEDCDGIYDEEFNYDPDLDPFDDMEDVSELYEESGVECPDCGLQLLVPLENEMFECICGYSDLNPDFDED